LSPFIIAQTIIISLLFILLGLTLGERGHIKEYRRFSKVMRSLSFLPLFFIKTAILLDVEFPLSLTFALEVCQFLPKVDDLKRELPRSMV
jgi:NADH:ubiquinone oxidoreductase subunit 4 (subunit M)